MSKHSSPYIWFNGECIPWENATVHVMAHALHYGSSVFEGVRVYETHKGPAAFRLTGHIERLFASARIYRIPMPYSPDQITSACREIVHLNELSSAYIRPIAFRGCGTLGVDGQNNPTEVAIAAFAWGAYLGEEGLQNGIDVGISSWNRVGPNTLPTMAKAGGNYLSSQLVAMEAKRHGYAEGIALDNQNMVSEGSGENVFVVHGGVLYTPPAWSPILPGLTRDTVVRLARRLGYEVREEPIRREALFVADEIFLVGTAAEVTPVRSVDGLDVGNGSRGPVTADLQQAFFGLFDGRTEDTEGWLEPIEQPHAKRLVAL
jgi:branched-chain amino acid aminotransferase